jgi:hypothetical protein
LAPQLTLSVTRVVPLLRRRWTAEQLTTQAALLARQNEALEDFAGLVAHELKSSLYGSAPAGRPRSPRIRRAILARV